MSGYVACVPDCCGSVTDWYKSVHIVGHFYYTFNNVKCIIERGFKNCVYENQDLYNLCVSYISFHKLGKHCSWWNTVNMADFMNCLPQLHILKLPVFAAASVNLHFFGFQG
jgi:hypothetical protein